MKNTTDTLTEELLERLQVVANVLEFNGPAFQLFAQEVNFSGKPVGELTLSDVERLQEKVCRTYAQKNS